ncbi:MAG: 1-acyl-sn-glycerol-3-phosphate acyltransferase [Muribaculaceae bacterium]|nr:1-acyl-sn-glycerol-3-phosphate acyltransferase [Muribaculaceae bacterium]
MTPQAPLRINLKQLLRDRLGRWGRIVPGFLVRKLEKLVCQEQLNELLEHNFPRRGADFCRGVLDDLDVTVRVQGVENLPPPSQRRVLLVCNHPLGGLDGISLIAWFSSYFGCDLQVVVNDLLMAVEPLGECFVPVNKHGAQSRGTARSIDAAMASDAPVLMFPAGLCSRQGDDGTIADLKWNKMFLRKARTYGRDIVPLYFDGRNSDRFYKAARRRVRTGLKFNFEMVLLPGEVFASRGKCFTVTCGTPLPCASLGPATDEEAARIRNIVYNLSTTAHHTHG